MSSPDDFIRGGESSATSTSSPASESLISQEITLIAKWAKERITLSNLSSNLTIGDIKEMLSGRTGVLPVRQKLIGLSVSGGGKLDDNVTLSNLKTKGNKQDSSLNVIEHQFILMGTPEEKIFVDPSDRGDLPDVVDDFDLDFNAGSNEWIQHVANGVNLKKFTDSTAVHVMNQPRQGKPLLVLDLDHTLLDFSSKSLQRDVTTNRVGDGAAASMKRPFMDEFLTLTYLHYDLVVWSQTSWRWLETKLTELGMLTHPGYRFCFVMDKTSMFSIISTKRDGNCVEHHVKPLQIIWTKFPHWGPHNTVHIDDLSRNFALNLSSGLKISPFYRKRSKARRDAELAGLTRYLEGLATSGLSFEEVNFSWWTDVVNGKRGLADK